MHFVLHTLALGLKIRWWWRACATCCTSSFQIPSSRSCFGSTWKYMHMYNLIMSDRYMYIYYKKQKFWIHYFFPKLVDYNLASQPPVDALHEHTQYYSNTLVEFNLAVLACIHQSTKLTSPPIIISCHTVHIIIVQLNNYMYNYNVHVYVSNTCIHICL